MTIQLIMYYLAAVKAADCGKTRLLVYYSILQSLKYPGIKGVWSRAHLSILKQTTLATFYDVCREWGLIRDQHWTFNDKSNMITFYNGSIIVLKDLFQKPSDKEFVTLGSLEASYACIDECAEISQDAYINLRNTLRYRLDEFGLIPKMLLVSNPTTGWLFDEFYLPYESETEPINQKYIHTIPSDNTFNSVEYLKILSEMTGSDRERLFLGNWRYSEQLDNMFHYDDLSNAFYLTLDESNSKTKYLSIDIALGGTDNTVIIYWEGLKIVKIYKFNGYNAPDLIEKIKEIEKYHRVNRSNIISDSIGVGAVAQFLKGSKLFVSNHKAIKNKLMFNLKTECFYKIASMFEEGKIEIEDEKYKDLIIQDFQAHRRYNVSDSKLRITPKKDVKAYLGRSPDFADAIIMRMWYEIRSRKIILDRA